MDYARLFCDGFIIVRLYVMQSAVLLSKFCPSVRPFVCLSVKRVDCDKTK